MSPLRPRREVILRYCTKCKATTEQVHLAGDRLWRCRKCESELVVVGTVGQATPGKG